MRGCFVDTWAYIALANRRDAGHEIALEVDDFLEAEGWVLVTSDWVLDETVTQLHAVAGAATALHFLDDIAAQKAARRLLVLNVSSARYDSAVAQFRDLAPRVPRLSLTDCSSFALMAELELRWAFTADRHFYAAGARIGPLVARVDEAFVFRAPTA